MIVTPRARNGTFCGVCGRPAAGNGPHALCDVCSAGLIERPGSAATQPGQGSEQTTEERPPADIIPFIVDHEQGAGVRF